jgi:hypothetical protein
VIEHNGRSAPVDEEIADVVLAMWKQGLDTIYSCQDIDGWAWIYLATGQHASRLQMLVDPTTSFLPSVHSDTSNAAFTSPPSVLFRLEHAPKARGSVDMKEFPTPAPPVALPTPDEG